MNNLSKDNIPFEVLNPQLDNGKALDKYLDRSPTTPLRDKINAFEELANTLPKVDLSQQKEIEDAGQLARVDLRVEHQFSFGVYARTLYIPKGVTLTGKIHKFENLNYLLKGKLQVSIGEEIHIVEAPFGVVSPGNTKRIAYALEDSIWVTILGTHERDIAVIDDYFVANSEEEYLEFDKQLKLGL